MEVFTTQPGVVTNLTIGQELTNRGSIDGGSNMFAAESFGFDADSLRLLRWWNQTRRSTGRMYLLWPSREADGVRLVAVEAAETAD